MAKRLSRRKNTLKRKTMRRKRIKKYTKGGKPFRFNSGKKEDTTQETSVSYKIFRENEQLRREIEEK